MAYLRYYVPNLVVACGVLGFTLGGPWVWLGVATILPMLVVDLIWRDDHAVRPTMNRAMADIPLYIHALLMFALWLAFIDWYSNTAVVSLAEGLGAVLSLGFLGAVPNLPASHELMHRRNALAKWLSRILSTFYGDPNRDIGHLHTHHIHFATPRDSDTPKRGETIYAFTWRASVGCYRDGYEIEKARLGKKGKPVFALESRVTSALTLLVVFFTVVFAYCGFGGVVVSALALVVAKFFVEAFNYFQHYGLVRAPGEHYATRHLWNHPTPAVRAVGFEITNHNDHHMDGYLPYHKLAPNLDGPQMPSIVLCFLIGLLPPVWHKFFAQPLLRDWDLSLTDETEKSLAIKANREAGWPDWLSEDSARAA